MWRAVDHEGHRTEVAASSPAQSAQRRPRRLATGLCAVSLAADLHAKAVAEIDKGLPQPVHRPNPVPYIPIDPFGLSMLLSP